jgi:hypothetical protein
MVTMGTKAMNPTTQPMSTATLLALLHDPRESSSAEIARHFANAHRLIESLPLASAENCFAHNWITSTQELWQAGDFAVARYQVGLVAKKLSARQAFLLEAG